MRINNIFSFLKKHRAFLLIGIIFAWTFLLWLESTFAAEEPVISKEDSEKVVKILNGFITAAAALMGMVTSFITMFLYPGWVNGTLFGLQDYLKIMWILVSNIVYFIFAFILIAIAFMNIIGKGEWTWELKQAMPKFIIGVLIVPFSWFFVQFLLSLSAILTVWVLTLPYDSFQWNELFEKAMENKELAGKEICKDVIISFNGDFSWAEWGVAGTTQLGEDANELDENIKCKEGGKITVKELLTGTDENGDISSNAAGLQNSIFGVMSIYSYGILRIDELDTINAAQLSSVKTIADLIFKIIFDVLFIAVYLLLMIALLLALFVRWVRLWVYMMLSPIFGLLYFFWKSGEWFWDSGKAFNIKEFVALALVPVYVSAALAFGLVFILVASQWIEDTNEGSDTMKAGGFSLTILWAHGDSGDDGREEKAIIWKLVVEIFGIVILWIAVMAALGASDTTKAITDPLRSFGSEVWKLAAKAPTYAPIIPTGSGMQSTQSLQKIWTSLTGIAQSDASTRAQNFMPGWSWSWTWSDTIWAGRVSDNATWNRLTTLEAKAQAARDVLRSANGNVNNLSTDTASRKALYDVLVAALWATTLEANGINSETDINSRDRVALAYWLLEENIPWHDIIAWAENRWIKATDIETAVTAANVWTATVPAVTTETTNEFEVTINGWDFSTPDDAWQAYARDTTNFSDAESVKAHLTSSWGLDYSDAEDKIVVDAVVAAYNAWLEAEDA